MLGLLGVTKQSTSNFARLVTIKTSYIRNFQDLIAELPDTDTKVKYDYDYEAIVEARSRLPPRGAGRRIKSPSGGRWHCTQQDLGGVGAVGGGRRRVSRAG